MPDVFQSARAFGLFQVMTGLLARTGVSALLAAPAPFTLLVPLDEAFESLAEGDLEAWARRFSHDRLIALLNRHILPGRWPAGALIDAGEARTFQGERLAVAMGDRLTVGGARVVQADVAASNGLLHVVDRVLVDGPASRAGSGEAGADRAGAGPRA